jgi:hypothetical protein
VVKAQFSEQNAQKVQNEPFAEQSPGLVCPLSSVEAFECANQPGAFEFYALKARSALYGGD